jgi:Predicted transcriptional regulator
VNVEYSQRFQIIPNSQNTVMPLHEKAKGVTWYAPSTALECQPGDLLDYIPDAGNGSESK